MRKEVESAVANYTQVPKIYNCAQAVVNAFGRDELVEAMKSCGGGKAPGSLCGALYAALELQSEKEHERTKRHFQENVGSLLCHEIKKTGKVSCVECVQIAAELVQHK